MVSKLDLLTHLSPNLRVSTGEMKLLIMKEKIWEQSSEIKSNGITASAKVAERKEDSDGYLEHNVVPHIIGHSVLCCQKFSFVLRNLNDHISGKCKLRYGFLFANLHILLLGKGASEIKLPCKPSLH